MGYLIIRIVQRTRAARQLGPVAQLGARTVRIRKVEGSIPFGSTKKSGLIVLYSKSGFFIAFKTLSSDAVFALPGGGRKQLQY